MKSRMVDLVGVCAFTLAAAFPATGSAQTSVPSPWISASIGSPLPPGTATYDPQRFTVSAGGVDIWGTSDQFRFVYQQVDGDFDIVSRVDSFTAVDPWSKIGVMARADLTAGSAHAFTLLSGANGLAFQRRPQAGGISVHTAGLMTGPPAWVRLSRIGTTLTGYSAADGGSWQKIDSATVALGVSVYAGLAITSHNSGSLATAVVSNVAVTMRSLPAGQQTQDIGSPAVAGTTAYTDGTYTITAAGTDIQGTSDQFRFVYQQVTGDVDVVARVNSIQNVNRWSKAGVMIRETLDANARNAMALMSASRGYSFQWRTDAGGATSYVRIPNYVAPAWVRLVRTDPKFEAFRSSDGATWTSMGSQIISMASTVYVGLAVTSRDATTAAKAVIDQLRIVQASPPANQPPTVALTSPAGGAVFTAPATITVSANAADPENQLARVEFYSNLALIGSVAAAPFSFTWSAVPAGTYSITAKAIDAAGASATSPAATIDVRATTSAPHYVVFHASADHATLVTSYRLDVFAAGADPATATPVASSDLGKPTPDAAGDITVDRATFFGALTPTSYVATVSAIGSGGESRSTATSFVR